MKNFESWNAEELELTFGLQEVKDYPVLTQWLSAKIAPNEMEETLLRQVQNHLRNNADSWNEDEVKFYAIAPLIGLVDFQSANFKPFNQRFFSAKPIDINGNVVELGGKPDLMVAIGKENPRQPFFFLHEYKQEKKRDTDPKGQLLAAMFAAQEKNKETFPLLGCYVVGRWWFFVVLDQKNWSHSLAFDATQEDIFDIFSILREAKSEIAKRAVAFR